VPDSDKDPIRITFEELQSVSVGEEEARSISTAPGERTYGNINAVMEDRTVAAPEHGSLFLKGWFYLGLAGLLGAVAGWAICEPWFVDGGPRGTWANTFLVPVMVASLCFAFGIAESVVERSLKKALQRAALALPLGLVFGFMVDILANLIYTIGMVISVQAGATTERNPALWIVRAIGWMVFGVAGGAVYGLVSWAGKKAGYGILGGVIGAGLGGLVFDPITLVTHGGAPSRAIGFALTGLATGIGMGVIESALKHRWLYVTAGPLAGKQFILYKPVTTIGSDQGCDIYLFKDATILPRHALLEQRGHRLQLTAIGEVSIAGVSVHQQVLQSGAGLRIGRYGFRYQEKLR
jgi:hypothetical protein